MTAKQKNILILTYWSYQDALIQTYTLPYVRIIRKIIQKKNFIHAWCTPAGILGYILSKTTGVPLIIDSYEPHAEAMVENGTWGKSSWSFKLLFFFEKLQSKHAQTVISAVEKM